MTGGHPLELLDEDFAVMVKNPGIPYTNPMVERALEKGIPVLTEVELAYLISEAPNHRNHWFKWENNYHYHDWRSN